MDLHQTDSRYSNVKFEKFVDIGRQIASRCDENDKNCTFDEKGWVEVTEAGLWRIPVPVKLGGEGLGWHDFANAIESLASTAKDLGFMISCLGHIGAIRLLLDYGNEAQLERWMGMLLNGKIAVTAMTEATGGSDLARMKLSASAKEDYWLLYGNKSHITNAPIASVGLVVGRMSDLDEKQDITLFFIDFSNDGISTGELERNLGIRTSPTSDIHFDSSKIEKINIIDEPGKGLNLLYRIIAFERALYGPIASGLIDSMIGEAMNRIEKRHAFGKPIADYQYIQGRITDMKIASVICRTTAIEALKQLENQHVDASITCSITKFMAGEKLLEAAEHLVQIHGHLGFMSNAISRQLRDSVGMRIAGGTSDIQRINIFGQMRRQYNIE